MRARQPANIDVTHYPCPNAPSPGGTHHMVQANPSATPGYGHGLAQRCEFCGHFAAYLRGAIYIDGTPDPFFQ